MTEPEEKGVPYTLAMVLRVSERLKRQVDEVVAEWRRLAAEGDAGAAAVLAEYERLA